MTKSSYNSATYIIISLLLAVSTMISFCIGRYGISYQELTEALFNHTENPVINVILFNVRLPGIIMALLAGGVLSMAGTSYQAVFRNPMVSPDILGVSSGAACGASVGILLSLNSFGIQIISFGFGLLAVFITYGISKILKKGNDEILMLILTGMIISALFGSAISLLKYVADQDTKLPAITFWMMGSLTSVTTSDIKSLLPSLMIGIIPLMLISWKLNALSLSEDEAFSLGINPARIRLITILCATLITASIISFTGLIGWIGLIIPHFCRFVIGADTRKLMPFSFLCGAIFLLWVDNISLSITALEIPIGIITSITGAPAFLLFLSKGQRITN